MSDVELLPERREQATEPDNLVHVVCCNPNLALCGEDVTGDSWVDVKTETSCPLCAEAENGPCGNPECPDRGVAW